MNTFLISDTHFGHKGVTQFLSDDGSKLRPWDNTEEMDEALVENWNSVVRPNDTVWHLGDVVINRKALPILGRLNGVKKLVMGNHDTFRLEEYAQYFKEIRGVWMLDKFVLSHVPLHSSSVNARWIANIHGHLHDSEVRMELGKGHLFDKVLPDPRYFNVSVERIAYAPIPLEEVKRRVQERQAWWD